MKCCGALALLALLALGLHVSDCTARTRARQAAHKAAPASIRHVMVTSGAPRDANAVANEFDGWLDAVAQSGQVSGLAVAIVKDDKVLLQRGIGYADARAGLPVTTDTVFRLASLSKAFASAL